MEPITTLIFLLCSVLHFFADVSLQDLSGMILPFIGLILKLALTGSPNLEQHSILSSIRGDVRTIFSNIDVDPISKSMVCCPACFSTYYFDNADPLSYPQSCTYQKYNTSKQCGTLLRNKSEENIAPVRLFTYQDINHWIGRMYARPEIEEHLDKIPKVGSNGERIDIWDGSILKEFKGTDGHLFMDKDNPAEGRLVFGLNIDGFNPYGNKQAGSHVSVTGIYLVCLNLPPSIRYKVENIFLLGIVPGPSEPSKEQINNLIKPLVDDLLVLWNSGIYLSKTPKYPTGRPVKGALIPLICDLPAARRTAGLGGHNCKKFCSECLQDHDDISDLNTESWICRNCHDHRRNAEAWLHATSDTERDQVFKAYGAKWSELLRLPYWDPTKFVVIDPMHGFYLRLYNRHVRTIWGMDDKSADDHGTRALTISDELKQGAQRVLQFGTNEGLKELNIQQLQFLCFVNGFNYGGSKSALFKTLLNFVNKISPPSIFSLPLH